jgi:hypothetical protein
MAPFALRAAPANAGPQAPPTLTLERFVFDERFPEAVATAAQASRQGVELAAISGDLTDLWYRHFDLQWKRAPMALAGMTDWHGLFVLETLAADRRMRVVYRGQHTAVSGGQVAHVLAGPASLIAQAAPAASAQRWETQLGRALTRCPLGRPAAASLELSTAASGTARREALYSWIIAPRSAVALTV